MKFVAAAAALLLTAPCGSAFALSEIQRETLPAPTVTPGTQPTIDPEAPNTDPAAAPQDDQPADDAAPDDVTPDEGIPDEGAPDEADTPPDPNRPHISQDGPLPEVLYDVTTLPEPVQRMRNLLLEATHKADVEALRPLLGSGDSMTQLSLGGLDGDPIQFLKDLSGDEQGHEILAIIEEVLSAGYVHLDAGTPNELYVWPYFFALPIDNMTPRQRVELFKIVTAGDYEDMKAFGAYIFYRVGITPEGQWAFFVAGD